MMFGDQANEEKKNEEGGEGMERERRVQYSHLCRHTMYSARRTSIEFTIVRSQRRETRNHEGDAANLSLCLSARPYSNYNLGILQRESGTL
jgi:hypothetical protein